jgi:hypothetical protein
MVGRKHKRRELKQKEKYLRTKNLTIELKKENQQNIYQI